MRNYKTAIILLLLLVGILFAQGLIWSEPVLLLDDTLDYECNAEFDATIIGQDSVLISWLGGRDYGQGVRVRIWGPDGLSPIDELFTDREEPSVGNSSVSMNSEDYFVFGDEYCVAGKLGDWRNIDLPDFASHRYRELMKTDYLGRPWVFGQEGYALPTVNVYEDSAWSDLIYLTDPVYSSFKFDLLNVGDSTIIYITLFTWDKSFLVRVLTDSILNPVDTIANVDIFSWSVNYFWTGDSIWYFGLRPWDGITYLDTAYMMLGYGIGEDYHWDTLDINPYNEGCQWYPKFCKDYEGGIWAYWYGKGEMTPDSTSIARRVTYNRIAKFVDGSWALIDSFSPTDYNTPLLLFDELHPYPSYLIYEGASTNKLWGVKCLGLTNIEEKVPQIPEEISIQAYPNPFNSSVRIAVEGDCETPMRIEIYDINGRVIAEIPANNPVGEGLRPSRSSQNQKTGGSETAPLQNEVVWTPDESLPSGVYLVRATIGGQSTAKRVVYLK